MHFKKRSEYKLYICCQFLEDSVATQQGGTTYVNLVQMMMPPHRSNYATSNTGQF